MASIWRNIIELFVFAERFDSAVVYADCGIGYHFVSVYDVDRAGVPCIADMLLTES